MKSGGANSCIDILLVSQPITVALGQVPEAVPVAMIEGVVSNRIPLSGERRWGSHCSPQPTALKTHGPAETLWLTSLQTLRRRTEVNLSERATESRKVSLSFDAAEDIRRLLGSQQTEKRLP
jgi:hypothetical protein